MIGRQESTSFIGYREGFEKPASRSARGGGRLQRSLPASESPPPLEAVFRTLTPPQLCPPNGAGSGGALRCSGTGQRNCAVCSSPLLSPPLPPADRNSAALKKVFSKARLTKHILHHPEFNKALPFTFSFLSISYSFFFPTTLSLRIYEEPLYSTALILHQK